MTDAKHKFEADVEKLHALTSTAVFQKAMDLFQYKWSRKEKQATEWYMAEWGDTLFHAGTTPPGAPSRILQIPQQNILVIIDLSRTTLPIMSALPWEISFIRHAKSWNFKVGRP